MMQEPKKIPMDPNVPRSKDVKKYRLDKLYPSSMEDDVYIMPDNDSIYTPINLDKINKTLDKVSNEDSENGN